jgi:hypothetical protein
MKTQLHSRIETMTTTRADSPCPNVREAWGHILKTGRQDPRRPLTTYVLEEVGPDGEVDDRCGYFLLVGRGVSLKTACRVASRYLTAPSDDLDGLYHSYRVYRNDRLLAHVSGFTWDWSVEYE